MATGKMLLRLAAVVLVASLYYLGAALMLDLTHRLNRSIAPTVPWFAISLVPAFASAFVWSGERSDDGQRQRDADFQSLARLVGLSVLLCVVVIIVSGALFNLQVISLPVSAAYTGVLRSADQIVAPIFAAITEEVCFRGILQVGLSRLIGNMRALVVVTAVFVLAHAGTAWFYRELALYITLSVVTGILLVRSRSVFPGMAVHVTYNGLFVVIPMLNGPVNLNRTPLGILLATSLLGAFLVWRLMKELKFRAS